MKFFADTAEIADIQELAATGLLDGVTTNPSLIAKSGRDFKEVTKEICALVAGPVSAEVVALDHATMMKRSEEHTSELQSLMRISYAVFCLKKKRNNNNK